MAHFACSLLSSLKQQYKSTTPTRSRSRGPLAQPLAAYDYGRPHRKAAAVLGCLKAPLQCCFGALERVVRTVANSPKRKETDGGIQRALPGWGPANRTAQIPKNPKATARKRIEQPRKSSGGAEQQRRAPRRGRCRGRHWPMATGVARAGSHTHTPTRPGGGTTGGV